MQGQGIKFFDRIRSDKKASVLKSCYPVKRLHSLMFRKGPLMENDVKKFVENDRFAKHLGVDMLEYGNGKAKASMVIQDLHLNSAGTVHGGAIFALADAVFSAASNSHGTLAMAINVSISYFKAVSSGTLTAIAEEVSINPKLATYLISVFDDKGNKIALFQGTVYKKKEGVGQFVK